MPRTQDLLKRSIDRKYREIADLCGLVYQELPQEAQTLPGELFEVFMEAAALEYRRGLLDRKDDSGRATGK